MSNYIGTYNDYKLLWIWKKILDKYYNEIKYLLVAKIYTMPECHRVVMTKNNNFFIVDKIEVFNKETGEVQNILERNPNVSYALSSTLNVDFTTEQTKHILTNFFFVRKLNSKNVEKFLFAEMI